jgi:aspartate/methionine/tyrosine aminotransferase
VLVVSPNNPTGSYLTRPELARLSDICHRYGLALIVDEVFADYPLDAPDDRVTDVALSTDVLAFSLGGLSKTVGLPQAKLGWIVAGGGAAERDAALESLEIIADSYLSVSTPVQIAAADLLARGAMVRDGIGARARLNHDALRRIAASFEACDVLTCEGGWYAVVRVPAHRTEDELVLELLERERVLVHPGYFFDFPREAYVVVSLLPPPDVFAGATGRMLRLASD